jgi:hypothetical protein
MQDNTIHPDRDKQESTATPQDQPTENTADDIVEDGVVYVVDEEGEPMDLSDRTYVSVEEMGEEETEIDEDDTTKEDE